MTEAISTIPWSARILQNLTFDFQKRTQTGERNEVYWGAGYQQYWDRHHSTSLRQASIRVGGLSFRRTSFYATNGRSCRSVSLVSAGIRVDYNSYRDLEYQPSLRLLYTPKAQSIGMGRGLARGAHAESRRSRHGLSIRQHSETGLGIPVTVIDTRLQIHAIGGGQNRRSRIPVPVRPAMVGGYFRFFAVITNACAPLITHCSRELVILRFRPLPAASDATWQTRAPAVPTAGKSRPPFRCGAGWRLIPSLLLREGRPVVARVLSRPMQPLGPRSVGSSPPGNGAVAARPGAKLAARSDGSRPLARSHVWPARRAAGRRTPELASGARHGDRPLRCTT